MTVSLRQPQGAAHTRIYAYGAARGERVVPNGELVGPIDSSDEWIRQRTGIVTRVRAVETTTAIDLAADAATEAVSKSGVAPDKIDAVIVAADVLRLMACIFSASSSRERNAAGRCTSSAVPRLSLRRISATAGVRACTNGARSVSSRDGGKTTGRVEKKRGTQTTTL